MIIIILYYYIYLFIYLYIRSFTKNKKVKFAHFSDLKRKSVVLGVFTDFYFKVDTSTEKLDTQYLKVDTEHKKVDREQHFSKPNWIHSFFPCQLIQIYPIISKIYPTYVKNKAHFREIIALLLYFPKFFSQIYQYMGAILPILANI